MQKSRVRIFSGGPCCCEFRGKWHWKFASRRMRHGLGCRFRAAERKTGGMHPLPPPTFLHPKHSSATQPHPATCRKKQLPPSERDDAACFRGRYTAEAVVEAAFSLTCTQPPPAPHQHQSSKKPGCKPISGICAFHRVEGSESWFLFLYTYIKGLKASGIESMPRRRG